MGSVTSHLESMECYACHADWAPQCYGCHITVDYSEGLTDVDWIDNANATRPRRPHPRQRARHQRGGERRQGLRDPLLPALGGADPGDQRRGPGQPADAGLPGHHHRDRRGRQHGGRERGVAHARGQRPRPRGGAAAHRRAQRAHLRELPQQSRRRWATASATASTCKATRPTASSTWRRRRASPSPTTTQVQIPGIPDCSTTTCRRS